MQHTKEWEMVEELYELKNEMNDEQSEFIEKLYFFLDPYLPFLEQMEGLEEGRNQEKWLYALYDFYCNENPDAFKEAYEE